MRLETRNVKNQKKAFRQRWRFVSSAYHSNAASSLHSCFVTHKRSSQMTVAPSFVCSDLCVSVCVSSICLRLVSSRLGFVSRLEFGRGSISTLSSTHPSIPSSSDLYIFNQHSKPTHFLHHHSPIELTKMTRAEAAPHSVVSLPPLYPFRSPSSPFFIHTNHSHLPTSLSPSSSYSTG